jgi:hypothetical protein
MHNFQSRFLGRVIFGEIAAFLFIRLRCGLVFVYFESGWESFGFSPPDF